MTQLEQLDSLIAAAMSARNAARTGDLFVSREGAALFEAVDKLADRDPLAQVIADIEENVERSQRDDICTQADWHAANPVVEREMAA